ncbi:MAG: Hsp20/alpha crystallin family protein [Blastocatellia bacterium]|nr:Hsp20/alpha crystallin family protein [Blastocatellia bacterium]
MALYSYDQVLTDVRDVYEQLTGLPAPKVDVKNPRFPLPKGVDPATLVQREINYLNFLFISSGISLRLSKAPAWTPSAEVYETPQEYIVQVELAGMAEEDVSVQQLNNLLIVRGNRRFRRVNEEAQYHSSERAYGAFERLFPLPNYVQPDTLETKLSDGIFEIKLRKSEAAATTDQTGKPAPGKASAKEAGVQKSHEEKKK